MENEQKVTTCEEFERKTNAELKNARQELREFIDDLCKDGKYHITVVSQIIGEMANQLRVGYRVGFDAGRLAQIDEDIKKLESIRNNLLFPECDI